jgi:hypothetical protein
LRRRAVPHLHVGCRPCAGIVDIEARLPKAAILLRKPWLPAEVPALAA